MRDTRRQRRERERLKRKTQEPRERSPLVNQLRKIPKSIYFFFSLFVALVGLLALWPWLSIEQAQRLRPKDPFGIILNVSNEGYLPLTNISVSCNFNLKTSGGAVIQNATVDFEHVSETLAYKHKLSLPCTRAANIEVPLKEVDLKVKISYKIWVFPARRIQEFSFVGTPDSRGAWYWLFKD